MPTVMQSQPGAALDPRQAWQPYEPDAKRPWTVELASHLYRRAAFGATRAELDRALQAGPQASVDRLLAPGDTAAEDSQFDGYDASTDSPESLRAWWLQRMLQSAHPLRERMTVFWHGHFAVSAAGISGPLVRTCMATLRRHALGRYAAMLGEVLIEPAVLIALQATDNRKARPHEDSARAVLQHWCLGLGNFLDADVQALARAYTGWFVLRERRRFLDREHDPAPQTLLGQAGVTSVEDAAKVLAAQPAAHRLIARKLYRTFVSEEGEPDEAILAPLAETLGREGDIAAAVGTILRSNLFFSPAALRQRVKSPLEYAIGLLRPMEARVSTPRLAQDLAGLGQSLYYPPTLSGWPEGRTWLDSAALVARANLAAAILASEGPYGGKADPLALAQKYGRTSNDDVAALLVELLLGSDVPSDARSALVGDAPPAPAQRARWAREVAYRVATLPENQLS